MKKLLFLTIFLSVNSYSKQIILDIPDSDIKIVENDVVNAEAWIRAAWAGKLSKCKERMIKTEISKSLIEKTAIPTTEDAIIQKTFSRPDYQSRKDRDDVVKSTAPVSTK